MSFKRSKKTVTIWRKLGSAIERELEIDKTSLRKEKFLKSCSGKCQLAEKVWLVRDVQLYILQVLAK